MAAPVFPRGYRPAHSIGVVLLKGADRQQGMINVAGFLDISTVNGPGRRAVIWVQGCPLRCKGCFNSELWEFVPRDQWTIDCLSEKILGIPAIEGITISGGEPFCQAKSLCLLAERIRKAGLNVMIFTGFPYQYIRKKDRASWNSLLAATDLLVAGPYVQHLRCKAPLISSSNQEIVHLSRSLEGREAECPVAEDITEFSVSPGGVVTTTGYCAGLLGQKSRQGIQGKGGI